MVPLRAVAEGPGLHRHMERRHRTVGIWSEGCAPAEEPDAGAAGQ